ncbi:hypothetical protein A0H81_06942 [Grifola frondosa]|uniref:Uncharacterized protein n=1 Tax=Grifola frondosa TaxID=5627 RepID=A0A1C7M7A3_GRIFR|nr:hypothetical protein A0H81_06942 [Grifola frondosa]
MCSITRPEVSMQRESEIEQRKGLRLREQIRSPSCELRGDELERLRIEVLIGDADDTGKSMSSAKTWTHQEPSDENSMGHTVALPATSGMDSFGGDIDPHAANDGMGPARGYSVVEGTGVDVSGEDVDRIQAVALELTTHLGFKLFEHGHLPPIWLASHRTDTPSSMIDHDLFE